MPDVSERELVRKTVVTPQQGVSDAAHGISTSDRPFSENAVFRAEGRITDFADVK
jgi:hypothetical protein